MTATSFTFSTPTGPITADHSETVGSLLQRGAIPARWPDVCRPLPVDAIDDETLLRFAARSAEEISASSAANAAFANPSRPDMGREVLFSDAD